MNWKPEQDESLRKMWDEGLSAAVCGARLGVTKNAIIGRAHRIGLKKRQGGGRKGGQRPSLLVPKSIKLKQAPKVERKAPVKRGALTAKLKLRAVEAAAIVADAVPVGNDIEPLVRFSMVRAGECRWIPGDVSGDPMCCGRPGKPFCAYHATRAVYRPAAQAEAA